MSLKGHSQSVSAVVFSPDGKRLAGPAIDQTFKIWDAATGEEILSLNGHTSTISRTRMQEPLWTGRPDPPLPPVPEKGRWPRKSVLAAFSLIPIGFLLWFGGLGIGLGGGGMESKNRHVLLRRGPADCGRGLH